MTLPIVALLFPGVTQLDFTGPVQVWSRLPGARVHAAWHRLEPIRTDAGFDILPNTTLSTAPPAGVLLVPGGEGVDRVLDDEEALAFLRRPAARARFVTSVCTGSLALAAAGLLVGRRATSHWASVDLLAGLGAIPVRERVVRDGNVITGAGVSAGLDLALTVAALLFGDEVARRVQLQIEYDPQPPFDAGSPSRPGADPQVVAPEISAVRRRRAPIIERAAARLTR